MKFPFSWRRNRIHDEALAWLARLKRGLREKEGPELLQWLERPRHRRTIAKAAVEWHGPEVLAILSDIFPIDPRVLEPPCPSTPRSHLYILGAMLLFFAAYVFPHMIADARRFGNPGSRDSIESMGDVYVTQPGKPRQVRLEDGSRLLLNGGTRVAVLYMEYVRSVYLWQGEVTFNAVDASHRPFHVHAAGRDLDSEAASYDVRVLSPTQMDLAVISGSVTVLPARRPAEDDTAAARREGLPPYSTDPVIVGKLQGLASQTGSQSGRQLIAQDLQQRLAWQQGL